MSPSSAWASGLERQLFLQGAGRLHIEHGLDALKGLGRAGGETLGDGFASAAKLCIFHTGPDEAPGGGVRGSQRIAEQRQALGARRTHQPRQVEGAAQIGHEAELGGEQLQKRGGAAGQHDVAGQRKAHSGACGDAIDRDHHRQPQPMPGLHHGVEVFVQAESGCCAAAVRGMLGKSLPMRSAPEQKARPEAVSTTARMLESESIAAAAARRSVIMARFSAFNRSGRLSVT